VGDGNPAQSAVSVVIGSLNRRWYLQRTIASVRAEMPFPEREIIVVDGGSRDGTLRWLAKQRDVITIIQHNRGDLGGRPVPRRSWGYFMNLGFKVASAPYVCMLSDDCLVVPGAIRRGLERFHQDGKRVGAVAFYWRNWPEQERYWVGRTFGGNVFVNHGLYSRKALESVDFADERAFRFYHADGDLTLRMAEAGWACVDSPRSFVEHYSHANLRQRAGNLETQRQDWTAYQDRWGGLGVPDTDWIEVSHRDAHRTADRYWGRRGRLTAKASRVRSRLAGIRGGVERDSRSSAHRASARP
jgi:GT2 family glycosyltransferase